MYAPGGLVIGRPKLEFNAAEPPNDKDSRFVLVPPDTAPLLPLLLLTALVPPLLLLLLALALPLFVVDPVGRVDDDDEEVDAAGGGGFVPPVAAVPLVVVPVVPDSEFPMVPCD